MLKQNYYILDSFLAQIISNKYKIIEEATTKQDPKIINSHTLSPQTFKIK